MKVRTEGPLKACEMYAEKVMSSQSEARKVVAKMQSSGEFLTDFARVQSTFKTI